MEPLRKHTSHMVPPSRAGQAYNTAMSGPRWIVLGVSLACALAQGPLPQHPRSAPAAEQAQPRLRVDTQMVLVPVTVNDKLNRPVSGLEKEHFRVFEDNVEQPIRQF